MLSIFNEIEEIVREGNPDNVLVNAPHCLIEVTSDNWNHCYSRKKAAFPVSWLEEKKYWTPVSRIDNAYGDRNLICTCEPLNKYQEKV
jgi:glycine dehydrogenase